MSSPLIFNVDGACLRERNSGKGHMGIGICSLVIEHSSYVGIGTSNRAEYKALIKCLSLIKEKELFGDPIEIRTDSQLIEGHLNKGWTVNYNFDLVEEAKQLCKEIGEKTSIQIVKIPRNQNGKADNLAKRGINDYFDERNASR